MAEVSSIVLFSDRPERLIAFYGALGIDFEEEDHGDGPSHSAADIGGMHLAVFGAPEGARPPEWRSAGSTFCGFYVTSLDETLAALTDLGTVVLVDHQVRDWGCRAVVEDPDGRTVEINQAQHCPAARV